MGGLWHYPHYKKKSTSIFENLLDDFLTGNGQNSRGQLSRKWRSTKAWRVPWQQKVQGNVSNMRFQCGYIIHH